MWELQEQGPQAKFLICDNDKKFPFAFERVLANEGVQVIRTPLQAPQANAYAEGWVGSARRECLDWLILSGRHHLERCWTSTSSITTVSDPTADFNSTLRIAGCTW